jgi:hypothetical protein
MTPNDAQIDVLMRRYAGQTRGDAAPDHLDADELNAFAEGSVPPATRARYVSHLADCDNCRQLVSQLAISSGAVAKAQPAAVAQVSWLQNLSAFFTPAKLRYAAFAVVLVAAVGIVFLVTQRRRESNFVASNEQANQTSVSAVKPDQGVVPQPSASVAARTGTTEPGTEAARNSNLEQERDESRIAKNTPPPPTVTAETSTVTSPPPAEKKAAEPFAAKSAPSYAPPPPGEERTESRSREQQNIAGLASGPRKSESSADKPKTADDAKEQVAKDRRDDYDSNRANMNRTAPANRSAGERPSGPQRNMDNVAATGRSANEVRAEAPKQKASPASPAKSEDTAESRSVGGRKFKRQGASWIDTKFKSSMSLRTVSRGSEEFSGLDSGLRSIAAQFSGEIIIVWKNKAYRIH